MNVFVEKHILILGFGAFLDVKVLGKVLIYMFAWPVQIISERDSQSKFQMLKVHQHGGSILGYVNLCKIFRQIFEVWGNVQT